MRLKILFIYGEQVKLGSILLVKNLGCRNYLNSFIIFYSLNKMPNPNNAFMIHPVHNRKILSFVVFSQFATRYFATKS